RRRHTRFSRDWSSDVCSSDLPFTIMGGQAGILQGERRWAALSVLYLLSGVPRLLIGTALIAWQPSELFALVGTGLGACAPVIAEIGRASCREGVLRPVDGEIV